MAEKSLSEKYLKFALANKILSKKEYKKGKDLSYIMSGAITTVLKKETSEELSKFGTLKKENKFEDGRSKKKVIFIADENFQKKISRKHKDSLQKDIANKKIFKILSIIIIIIALLLVACAVVFGIYGEDIKRSYENARNKMKLEKQRQEAEQLAEHNRLLADVTSDETTDMVIKKENIDVNKDNVYKTDNEDLVVKIRANDEVHGLKEGEHKQELIEYNGKIYKKTTYIIVKNDTLWDISFRFLDNAFRWPFIHNLNKYIINPDLIEPGDPLIIYTENSDVTGDN